VVGNKKVTFLCIPDDPHCVSQKFLDAVKLEPNSDSELDPLPDIKHDELVVPTTSPVILKSKEVVCLISFSSLLNHFCG
jgi:hypothetical protein